MTYSKGKNPNSLANLTGEGGGRPTIYSEEKKRRSLTVTDTGWQGAIEVCHQLGCGSVSELLERIGRGEVKINP